MERLIYVETLGCPKNLVDSEDFLKYAPGELRDDPKEADLIVLNTCAFIDDAVRESVDRLLEFVAWKKQKKVKLVVMGCLVNRFGKEELRKLVPEVDEWLRTDEREGVFFNEYFSNRSREGQAQGRLTPSHYRYLKIGEGCDNHCSYCTIPAIRGPLKSGKIQDILEDFDSIINEEHPPKEIILLAQDLTKYGDDFKNGRFNLPILLKEMNKRNYQGWVRLLYCNPDRVNSDLISVIKDSKMILPYFDMPIQHISDPILKGMNRKYKKRDVIETYELIKKEIPLAVLRTTVIVGFPGETESRFEELLNFLEEYPFDKCGAFRFQKQKGTAAANLKSTRVSKSLGDERVAVLMGTQREISQKRLRRWIGKQYECLVEEIFEDGEYSAMGRTWHDAPEIDGVTYLKNQRDDLKIGDAVTVEIQETDDFDMYGEIVS